VRKLSFSLDLEASDTRLMTSWTSCRESLGLQNVRKLSFSVDLEASDTRLMPMTSVSLASQTHGFRWQTQVVQHGAGTPDITKQITLKRENCISARKDVMYSEYFGSR
jgi:hypothetical protein